MKFLPKSLTGQLVLILLLALVSAQGVSLFLFAGERLKAVRDIHRENVISRTVILVRLLQDTPVALQSRVVAAATSRALRFRLSAAPSAEAESVPVGERGSFLVQRLSAALQIPAEKIRITRPPWRGRWERDDDRHDYDDHHDNDGERGYGRRWHRKWFKVEIGFSDGQWLNVVMGPPPDAPRWGKWFFLSLLFSGVAIAGVAVVAGRRVARPMRELASAADRLGRGESVGEVKEAGPSETRQTIRAFNQMKDRLDRYLSDRTAMLAAISHDLKTPITSLRLRAEFIEDAEMREKILSTLEEMQAMTESTLDFIREDASRDPGRPTAVGALVESVVDDFSDTGQPVTYAGGPAATAICRPSAIRRVLRNLIGNAIAYGDRAIVSTAVDGGEIRIYVDDDGPGVPAEELERVFDPFTRLDASRNRSSGGVGLGLAIARSVARGHGGDVTLVNRVEGGLRAVLTLPIEPK